MVQESLGTWGFWSSDNNCGLVDSPHRNTSFTWSKVQENLVCKRLNRFLFTDGGHRLSEASDERAFLFLSLYVNGEHPQ